MFIHSFPVFAQGEAIVTCVRESHSARGNHTALAHGEARDNRQRKNRQRHLLRHALHKVRRERLSEIRVEDSIDINDRVRHYELQKPPEDAARCGRQNNSAWRGEIGI